MNSKQRAVKRLSLTQQAVYRLICENKILRAYGVQITSCKSLERAGLIKHNSDSDYKNEYVLQGEPVKLPEKYNQPGELVGINKALKRKPAKEIKPEPELYFEPKHIPEAPVKPLIRARGSYDNLSREDHVSKWIQQAITSDKKAMVKVKCLKDYQMGYIMIQHEQHTAKEMAEKLKVDVLSVKIFCQANAIVPIPETSKRKSDSFHVIPEAKRLRMKRVGYNPQNKTA